MAYSSTPAAASPSVGQRVARSLPERWPAVLPRGYFIAVQGHQFAHRKGQPAAAPSHDLWIFRSTRMRGLSIIVALSAVSLSKMMFRSRTAQIIIFAAGSTFAVIAATAGDHAHGEGNLDASYTISFARIPVGEITATAVFGQSEYAMSARRVRVASSKHYWWTVKPRSPHRAPSKAVIRCRRLSPLRSSRTPKPRM